MKKYDDSHYINTENYLLFCNTNEQDLKLPLKGIVVEFPGLGGGSCLGGGLMDLRPYDGDGRLTSDKSNNGILIAYLFPGPWSWGNKGAVRYADAVVSALAKKYNLEEGFPLVACGGSMGSVGALMYAAESKFSVCACAIACPITDVEGFISSEAGVPRTIISAAAGYDMPLQEAIHSFSPIHRVKDMPAISYYISSDGNDLQFAYAQCDEFIEKLRAGGADVEYHEQPGLDHGGFTPEVWWGTHEFIRDQILARS